MDVTQPELISQILRWLDKRGVKSICSQQLNVVIQAATMIVDSIRKESVSSTPGMGLSAWLASGDTGLSSRCMARILTEFPVIGKIDWPHDPDDFGRCVRLLEAAPELRHNFSALLTVGPEWNALATHWPELEALYREEWPTGSAPKLYARMQELFRGLS